VNNKYVEAANIPNIQIYKKILRCVTVQNFITKGFPTCLRNKWKYCAGVVGNAT